MFHNCKSLTGVPSTLFDLNIENKSPYNCDNLFLSRMVLNISISVLGFGVNPSFVSSSFSVFIILSPFL